VLSEVWLETLADHLGPGVNPVYATAHDGINAARAQAAAASPGAGHESPGGTAGSVITRRPSPGAGPGRWLT
jgi:hypothetical protein